MKLRITPRAQREINRIDAWWRQNRPAAPNLFIEELVAAIDQALAAPQLGKRYTGGKRADVRYIIMKRTERNVYYVVEHEDVVLLGVWGARRRRGPNL